MANKDYELLIELNEREFILSESRKKAKLRASELEEHVVKARKNGGSLIPKEFNILSENNFSFNAQNRLIKLYRHKNKLISDNKYNWNTVLRESKMNNEFKEKVFVMK